MHDVDRTVATIASRSWKEVIITDSPESSPSSNHLLLTDTLRLSLNAFVQRFLLDPSGIYLYLNPLPPPPQLVSVAFAKKSTGKMSSAPTPRKDDGDQTPRSKQDEQEESEQDRRARLRIGALGAARWILGMARSLPLMTTFLAHF